MPVTRLRDHINTRRQVRQSAQNLAERNWSWAAAYTQENPFFFENTSNQSRGRKGSRMREEQHMILDMLQKGKLTLEEADRLLAALDASDVDPDVSSDEDGDTITITQPKNAPDMRRFRRYWEIPFFVGLVLLGVAGLCISNTGSFLLAFCGWGVFALALLVVILAWFSQYAPWVHVRVREHDGSRFAFSLPLPLGIAQPFLALARPFVRQYAGKTAHQNFELAASLVSTLGTVPAGGPISIEVDEEDGDHVQVFFG